MSRYVQRCLGCRTVRGMTAFRLAKNGGRKPVCRWCETTAETTVKVVRDDMAPLLREQNSLVNRLARVRTKIRALEAELLDAERRRSA